MSTLTSVFNIQVAKAQSATIMVPHDYPTIKEAIAAASAGDTIIVTAGYYVEGQITVNKPVCLIAEGFVVVDGPDSRPQSAFYVASSNVTLRGFVIKESDTGILLGNVDWCVIEENFLTENYDGIRSWGLGDHNTIRENRITAYEQYAIALRGQASFNVIEGNVIIGKSPHASFFCAIHLDDYFQRNIIRGNTIERAGFGGIYLNRRSSRNNVTGNRISDGGQISLWDSDWNIIENNIIEDHQSGINLGDSSYNLIRRNTLRNITERFGSLWGSIMLYYGGNHRNTIEKNFLFECHSGIVIKESTHTYVSRNMVLRGTGYGLAVAAHSDCTTIEKNVVLLNQQFDLYWDRTGNDNTWTKNVYRTKNW